MLERTEVHCENLRLCLTLWDGVVHLGTEVDSWADCKLGALAQSSCCQSVSDIKLLQVVSVLNKARFDCNTLND